MNIPDNLKFTKDHEWVRIEGNIGVVGITDFAQSELGDVVFVDINPNISEITAGEAFGTIEAVKTVSDLYGPFNGKVVEINPLLENTPELINNDPFGDGWMIKVEIDDPAELAQLLDAAAYKDLIGQ